MDKTVLRRLTGDVKKRRFAVIDLEARKWVNPYAVGFYDGSSYFDFITDDDSCVADTLVHILQPAYTGFWIYAHNGGNYDFLFMVKALLHNKKLNTKYLVELTPIGSCIVRMDVSERLVGKHEVGCSIPGCKGCVAKTDKSTGVRLKWTFVDSARLMPMQLKDIGEIFGITKKVELQMSYDDLAKYENRDIMRHYLKTDCVSLFEGLTQMQDKVNRLGGQIGITLPASSLDLFRRKFLKDDIATNRHWKACPEYGVAETAGQEVKCQGCMHDFIRAGYFGGRTEIYRMKFAPYDVNAGDEWADRIDHIDRALMYDFNSHYPNCMLAAMPTGEAIELEGLDQQAVINNSIRFTGLVDCDVHVPDTCYLPPLPVRHDGKLIFPTGNLRGVWDAAELALLPLVGGRILTTRKSLWFETSSVFVRFVRALYQYRNKKLPGWNKAMDRIAKDFLNSLYGKFGMREQRQQILVHPDSPSGMKCVDLDSDVWTNDVRVSPSYIVPQLSVHVTALARVGLWKKLMNVLEKGGRIYYVDTDSVVCSGVTLETSGDLGDLKQEAVIKRAEFVLPKLYLIETEEENSKKKREKHLRIKAKGMGPGIRLGDAGDDELDKQLSEKEFMDLVTKGVPIERHRLTKMREGLNGYAKKAFDFPKVMRSTKELRTEYDKRTVLDDYDTRPLNLQHF